MVMPSKTNPTIVVDVDGKLIAWTDGQFGGDKELIKQAEYVGMLQRSVHPWFLIEPIRADLSDEANRVGALAAMLGISPGRAIIREIDDSTMSKLSVNGFESSAS